MPVSPPYLREAPRPQAPTTWPLLVFAGLFGAIALYNWWSWNFLIAIFLSLLTWGILEFRRWVLK